MVKKQIIFDERALDELKSTPKEVQTKFISCVKTLKEQGYLNKPDGKKLSNGLFEMRVRVSGAWRGLYFYYRDTQVIILRIFQKKSEATPEKEIKIALSRLSYYK